MSETFDVFDLGALSPAQRYKLLSSAVVPRPIALVGTRGPEGVDNAAPFSFFNVFSEDPPLVILGLKVNDQGERKDTARNIASTKEFVVNLVDEPLAEAMNICAVDFPPDVSEIDMAKLTLADCRAIAPRRIVEAPIALECREVQTLHFGDSRDIVIGEVLHVHARQGLVDPKTLNMDMARYTPVGRLFGGYYSRQAIRFEMPRLTLAQWTARAEDQG